MSTQKVIYINSKNRTSGTNEDFIISKVVEEFRRPPKTVKLISACVPYSWNNLLVGTELTITEDGLAPYVVALDPGFYTGITLAAALKTAIEAGSDSVLPLPIKLRRISLGFQSVPRRDMYLVSKVHRHFSYLLIMKYLSVLT